ncbi:MAG: hypothetical protein HY922_12475 [Elusimicrobia bacterium]|nr:hypothetical protein [Elusimicrobiota bacterium]
MELPGLGLKKAVATGLIASLLAGQQGFASIEAFAQTVANAPAASFGSSLGPAGAGFVQTPLPSNFALNPAAPLSGVGLPAVKSLPALALPQSEAALKPVAGLAQAPAVIPAEGAAEPVRPALIQGAASPIPVVTAPLKPARKIEATTPRMERKLGQGLISGLLGFGKALFSGRSAPEKTLRQTYDNSALPKTDDSGAVEGEAFAAPRRSGLLRGKDGKPVDTPAEYRELKELKEVLGDGTAGKNGRIEPFGFILPGEGIARARAAGLEGFLYSKLENERASGEAALAGQVQDYFSYLDALYEPVASLAPLRRELAALRSAAMDGIEKNRMLNSLLVRQVRELQARMRDIDKSAWGRSSGVYMILTRAYNRMKPGKGFFDSIDDSEFDRIRREANADVIWLLDIFEIGVLRRWGTGGGSPYSIQGYRVKKELGGDEAFKRFVERAHAAGLRVMTDFIPNHVSLDSELIRERPEATLHIVPPQNLSDEEIMKGVPRQANGDPVFFLVQTDNYPENVPNLRTSDVWYGRRVRKKILVHHPHTDYGDGMWVDMAQIDYSRPEARAWEIEQARRVFEDFGVDAIRRDMAYEQTNARFFQHWAGVLEREQGQGASWAQAEMRRLLSEFKSRWAAMKGSEFWREFTDATKSRFPSAYAIDEVYSHSTDMSRAGSDAIYDKNDHDLSLGQNGLYDAMLSRDAPRIRAALRNAAFRAWQRGGAAMVSFIGTHDGGEGNPWDKFGPVARAAAAIALFLRPILVYNGVEQGVGQSRNISADLSKSVDREKSIPFDIPVSINWGESDAGNKAALQTILEKSAEHRDLFERGAMEVLDSAEDTPIVAYTAGRKDEAAGRRKALLIAANFSEGRAWGRFRMGRPVLKAFGAFEPKAGRKYVLRDFADKGSDGSPKTYVRTGEELLKDGISISLDGGRAHVFEIEEI